MTLLVRESRALSGDRTTAKTSYDRPRWDFGDFSENEPTEFYDNPRPPYVESIEDLDVLRELPEG